LEFDIEKLRGDVDAHLLLPLVVARKRRQGSAGGTLLFMGWHRGRRTAPGFYFLSALNAARPAMTKNLALELAPVRVNLIAAGFVDTPLSAALLGDQLDAPPGATPYQANLIRRGRTARPDIAARWAVHLMTNTAVHRRNSSTSMGASTSLENLTRLSPGVEAMEWPFPFITGAAALTAPEGPMTWLWSGSPRKEPAADDGLRRSFCSRGAADTSEKAKHQQSEPIIGSLQEAECGILVPAPTWFEPIDFVGFPCTLSGTATRLESKVIPGPKTTGVPRARTDGAKRHAIANTQIDGGHRWTFPQSSKT
jgi:hypothetical protein